MKINGTEKSYPSGTTVSELLKQEGFQEERIAVECNGTIVPKREYGTVRLQEQDQLEVVRFVGGG